ncbi:hypothetical protein [Sorangium sp. So ce1182]|uniref:hypothetical protein n=1 Tax=Sorangium sp. So ce1182 TaxID=3133334 RepID=UPI003F63AED6
MRTDTAYRSLRRPLFLVLLAVVFSSGCKRLKTGAREEFGRKHSCPEDRITVRSRDDVKWGSVVLANRPAEAPPDEVKNDPGRLAKWQKDRAEEDAATREGLDDLDVFEVKGCGHEVLMACAHPAGSSGEGVATDEVACWEQAIAKR